jgi:hypothetical protein
MEIMLDRKRELEVTGLSLMKFEERSGKTLFEIGNNPSMTTMIILIWACLKEEEDLNVIAKSINMTNIKKISETFTKLLTEASEGNE